MRNRSLDGEIKKASLGTGVEQKSKKRRRADLEKMLTGLTIVKATVKEDEVSLMLSSHTVIKISLRSTDEGPLHFGWHSLDVMKTDADYKI